VWIRHRKTSSGRTSRKPRKPKAGQIVSSDNRPFPDLEKFIVLIGET
jgi:hypothetical protein